jgi:parallel beta-helix repeat protein
LGRSRSERRTNVESVVDEVPKVRRVDDRARDELAHRVVEDSDRRDALRYGALVGGGVLAGFLAGAFGPRVVAAPGDGTGGTTISDTDIDAKRIAGVRIATEFAPSKHAGSDADPWPASAIQSALADLPASGGAVFVPSGVYNVSSPLAVSRSNVLVSGTGASSYLKTDGSGFTPNVSGMVEIDGAFRGIVVEGLALDGTNTDTGRGVLITGGSEVLVRQCTFLKWLGVLSQRGRGLTVVHNPGTEAPPHKGVRVDSCTFTDNQIGIVMHRTIYVIQNCYFDRNVWDGMYMEGTARGAVIGNLVTFAPRTGIFLIFTDRETVVGNRVEDCGSGVQVYEARGMSIVGNHFERCGSAGIDIRTNSAHCVASGNVVGYCSGAPGVQLLNNVADCVVSDNVLRANGDGVAVLSSSSSRIDGNVCLENGRAGIYVNNSSHIRILANRALAQRYGILAEGTTDYLIVRENDLRGNTTAATSLVGANRIVGDNWES